MISGEQLKNAMNNLCNELNDPIAGNTTALHKQVIAKAVQLGMKYQEQKIWEGIQIVFNELHTKK